MHHLAFKEILFLFLSSFKPNIYSDDNASLRFRDYGKHNGGQDSVHERKTIQWFTL